MRARDARSAAVSATVTGDDGNPAALARGRAAGAAQHGRAGDRVHVDAGDAARGMVEVHRPGPASPRVDRQPRAGDTSTPNDDQPLVAYRGNGTYTLARAARSPTRDCTTRAEDGRRYTWTVGAVGRDRAARRPAADPRQPNSFSRTRSSSTSPRNPGAITYEIKYAKGGVVQPDGSHLSPALKDAFLNSATGKVEIIGAREPGTYTIVARAPVPATTTRRGARRSRSS